MNFSLRQETIADHTDVSQIIQNAFMDDPHGDQTEHLLVGRLRKSQAFVPELSIVAELNGELVGHILLTKIIIRGEEDHEGALALAPVSVLPKHQGKGIGGKLIMYAHKVAKSLGFGSIILLGHAEYYPRFGYRTCKEFKIRLPFEVPEENCMAIELQPEALANIHGVVVYDPAFFV